MHDSQAKGLQVLFAGEDAMKFYHVIVRQNLILGIKGHFGMDKGFTETTSLHRYQQGLHSVIYVGDSYSISRYHGMM